MAHALSEPKGIMPSSMTMTETEMQGFQTQSKVVLTRACNNQWYLFSWDVTFVLQCLYAFSKYIRELRIFTFIPHGLAR